jgi:pimeloyl-ACP methyl ester carboxylesterase
MQGLLILLIFLVAVGESRGAEPMRKGSAKVNGTSLYYEISGAGFPLVLLSGGGTLDRRAWDDQVEVFAKFYRVLRYDIRGIGRSARPSAPFSHSQDLYALLTHLGIKKAHILGLSFSGAIAIDFALEHPDMVDHLILAAAGTSSDAKSSGNLESLQALSGMAKKEGLERTIQVILALAFFISQQNQAAREKIRRIYIENRDLFETGFPLVVLWQPTAPPASERLAEIGARVLILEAENDHPAYKVITEKLKSGLKGAKKAVIPGAAHVINLDQPEAFNKAVLDFLPGEVHGHRPAKDRKREK